ncbi:unnamed protein product [Protopolystoma xenopodis]|uniref:Uncharacterized protein n=1 Tax=Protopolystoma xenopodis TaxID=117903 RepID=A0A448WJH3_9PLAT|nr:unnamed protein product [Protopolystoma xenopodis]
MASTTGPPASQFLETIQHTFPACAEPTRTLPTPWMAAGRVDLTTEHWSVLLDRANRSSRLVDVTATDGHGLNEWIGGRREEKREINQACSDATLPSEGLEHYGKIACFYYSSLDFPCHLLLSSKSPSSCMRTTLYFNSIYTNSIPTGSSATNDSGRRALA